MTDTPRDPAAELENIARQRATLLEHADITRAMFEGQLARCLRDLTERQRYWEAQQREALDSWTLPADRRAELDERDDQADHTEARANERATIDRHNQTRNL